jgi:hypothetical protein
VKNLKSERAEITIAYRARRQFLAFHSRAERFACIVTHRRAGKTVACIQDLHRAALTCERMRPRFAYMSPFLKQAKSVAWDYLRAAVAAGRQAGASIHESELRVDYPSGAQVRLFGADNADATADELDIARRDLSEEQYAQEFECSFDAAVVGAYYGRLINQAKEHKRIANVPSEPSLPVWTAWDLGIADATAIWFAQIVGREIRIVDYYESSGVELAHYVRELQKRDYLYGGHIVPHDAQAKELGTGKSRIELMQSLGLRNVTLAPSHFVEDGIEAVRVFLPKCWFDAHRCARGIDALALYRAEYDERRATLKPRPVHDWTSHAADAFRYLAMTLDHAVMRRAFSRPLVYPKLGLI